MIFLERFLINVKKEGLDVSIISGDRDTLQLATEHIKVRIPKTKQERQRSKIILRLM